MRQRVMIAMALINNPEILIADEPTTALDVTTQAQILRLMERLQAEYRMAIVMITHDLGVVAELADDVIVMYGGRVVEQAKVGRPVREAGDAVHVGPAGLAAAARTRPARGSSRSRASRRRCSHPPRAAVQPALRVRDERLPAGAAARLELHRRTATSTAAAATSTSESARRASGTGRAEARDEPSRRTARARSGRRAASSSRVSRSTSRSRAGSCSRSRSAPSRRSTASASRSTRARRSASSASRAAASRRWRAASLRLLEPTGGKISFDGRDITHLDRSAMRPMRREMMMVFQDPYASLNPRKRVGVDRRRAARGARHRHRRRAQAPRPGAARDRRSEPGALQPLPARVLRWPAPAHRHRARARRSTRS